MVALEMIPKMARAERFVSLAPKIFGGGGGAKMDCRGAVQYHYLHTENVKKGELLKLI